MKHLRSNNQSGWGVFLLTFVPLAAASALVLLWAYQLEYSTKKRAIEQEERRVVEVESEQIERDFESIYGDLMFLANQNELLDRFAEESGEGDRWEVLHQEYKLLSGYRGIYDQIRFLDREGQERSRVDLEAGVPTVIPEGELQNKGDRYYFEESIVLPQGRIYISPLDLNVENGEVERPLKPMLRFATPVFDRQGRKQGILILNYLAANIISKIDSNHTFGLGELLLLTEDGVYLKGFESREEGKFAILDETDDSFTQEFDGAWEAISSQKYGQIETESGLFSFATVEPLEEILANTESSGEVVYEWKLISYLSPSELSFLLPQLETWAVMYVAFLVPVGVGYWWLLQSRIRQRSAESEREKLIALAENSTDFIAISNLDRKLLYLNRAGQKMVGIDNLKDVRGTEFLELIPEDDRAALEESILPSVWQHENWKGERQLRNLQTGETIPVECNIFALEDLQTGTTMGVGTVARDIRDRKAAELQLRNTLADLRAIINNLADGLLVTDIQGNITRYNPTLLEILGWEKDIAGSDCRSLSHPEIAQLIEQTRLQPERAFTTEVELTGQRIGQALGTAICPHVNGKSTSEYFGTAISIRDVTAEKAVDRMKTDFISTVSHELRTPLTSVLGFAKLIDNKLKKSLFPLLPEDDRKVTKAVKQVAENLGIVISEGQRLTALINDVLDIAKMEAGKIEWDMESLSVVEIVERAIAAVSSLLEESRIELVREIADDLPEAIGDRDRLIQVVINLLSNAIKFTDKGKITCRVQLQENAVEIAIADTGMGIAAEDLGKVFDQFKQVGDTLTDKPKGTGLGLPICKQIIEHHGGQIWAESELGKGSTFAFTLPRDRTQVAAAPPLNVEYLVEQLKARVETTPGQKNIDRQPTILVVDDDTHIRQLLRQQIEGEGYQVREADDGMEAIQQAKNNRPDLILMDVMMPKINGFDAAAVLKNDPNTATIPIIMLSIVEDKERGLRLGIDRYFTKPINSEELLPEIDSLLTRGSSNKKVLVFDRDLPALKNLSRVLQSQGYTVVEASSGSECVEKAIASKPDTIIVDYLLSQQHDLVKMLRFEKGLENICFLFSDDRQLKTLVTDE